MRMRDARAETPQPARVLTSRIATGMVLTDLLLQGATPRSKALFNALAEQPETAAAELVPALRAAHARAVARRTARAAHLKVLTVSRAASRMALLPLLRGRFFDAAGRATYLPEHVRIAELRAARDARAAAALRPRRRPAVALAYATGTLALLGTLAALGLP